MKFFEIFITLSMDIYLVNVQCMRKIFFSNFVFFSESPNLNVSSAAKYANLKETKYCGLCTSLAKIIGKKSSSEPTNFF